MVLYSEQGHDPTSTCCLGPRDAMFRLSFGLLFAVRPTLIELLKRENCKRTACAIEKEECCRYKVR